MNTWLTAIHIKPSSVDDFIQTSAPFAGACLREAGLVSFALLQRVDDPSVFSMFDVYHDDDAREAHLKSEHYLSWQESIAPMLDEPMMPLSYQPIFPPPEDWEHHLEA